MITRTGIRLTVAIVALVLLVTSVALAQGEKVDLKLRLKQGQTFKLMLTQANGGAANVGNQGISSTETLKLGLIFNVEAVETDGTARLKVTFDNPAYSVSTQGQPGADQVLAPLGKAFSALGGRSFMIEVTQAGVVRSLTGLDSATGAALQTLAGQPEPLRSMVSTLFSQAMAEPMWKHAMSEIFWVIPDGPVAIGERWSRQFAVSSPGGGQQGVCYLKITERAGGISKVKVYQDVKSAERTVGPNVRLTMKGVSEGTAEVDEATGLLLRIRMASNLQGSMAGASGKGSSSAPLAIRSSMSIDRYQ